MIYCDYNASAPLCRKLRGAFFDLPFANPSSQHSLGKKAMKVVRDCDSYLKEQFQARNHKVVFHSGSTEGSNLFIQGLAQSIQKEKKNTHFIYSETDHPCIRSLAKPLKEKGIQVHTLTIEKNLLFPKLKLKNLILEILQDPNASIVLNHTWVNNEAGFVWDLEEALELKALSPQSIFVHVDSTQSVGKIKNYQSLLGELDCYTYSGHKFGALKGVGWSFISNSLVKKLEPLFYGGGHQEGLRPGTFNTHGIYSLHIALEDMVESLDFTLSEKNIEFLREGIKKEVSGVGEVLELSGSMNSNTVFMYFNQINSQLLIPAFDMEGVSLGAGSACSSGTMQKSHFLASIGLESVSSNGLRLSVSPYITRDECESLLEIFKKVLSRLCG